MDQELQYLRWFIIKGPSRVFLDLPSAEWLLVATIDYSPVYKEYIDN